MNIIHPRWKRDRFGEGVGYLENRLQVWKGGLGLVVVDRSRDCILHNERAIAGDPDGEGIIQTFRALSHRRAVKGSIFVDMAKRSI